MDQERNNLLHALENETNSSIMNLTSAKIKEHKNTILQKLQLGKSDLKKMHKKLSEYRYCTDDCSWLGDQVAVSRLHSAPTITVSEPS